MPVLPVLGVALLPLAAYPLGIGDLHVYSSLNQPLRAEVQLLSVNQQQPSSRVVMGVAPAELFERFNMARPAFLDQLEFKPVKRDGQYFVEIRSSQPLTASR
ncbi:MAG: hypothetical protein R3E95_18795 [Thiolinea sp.]